MGSKPKSAPGGFIVTPPAGFFVWIILILAAVILAACSPAAQPTPTVVAEPTETTVPTVTATAAPSATPEPTATPLPSPTAVSPLALAADGFNAWCLPIDFYSAPESGTAPWVMPDGARPISESLGYAGLQVPALSCTLVFTFNQAMPQGAELKAYQGTDMNPWLTAKLLPAGDDPQVGYVVLDHSYIINPPYWEILYRFALSTADNSELWSDTIRIFKATPEACWDGSLPNPVTLECPINDR